MILGETPKYDIIYKHLVTRHGTGAMDIQLVVDAFFKEACPGFIPSDLFRCLKYEKVKMTDFEPKRFDFREPVVGLQGPYYKLIRIFQNKGITDLVYRDSPDVKPAEKVVGWNKKFAHAFNIAQIVPSQYPPRAIRFFNSWGSKGQRGLFTIKDAKVFDFKKDCCQDCVVIDINVDRDRLPQKYRTALDSFKIPNINLDREKWFDFFDKNFDRVLDLHEIRGALLFTLKKSESATVDIWIKAVWDEYASRDGVSRERFLAPDGLCDAIIGELRDTRLPRAKYALESKVCTESGLGRVIDCNYDRGTSEYLYDILYTQSSVFVEERIPEIQIFSAPPNDPEYTGFVAKNDATGNSDLGNVIKTRFNTVTREWEYSISSIVGFVRERDIHNAERPLYSLLSSVKTAHGEGLIIEVSYEGRIHSWKYTVRYDGRRIEKNLLEKNIKTFSVEGRKAQVRYEPQEYNFPIISQPNGDGSCYAHAIARSLHRLLLIVGRRTNYQNIYEYITKRHGLNGVNSVPEVLDQLLSREISFDIRFDDGTEEFRVPLGSVEAPNFSEGVEVLARKLDNSKSKGRIIAVNSPCPSFIPEDLFGHLRKKEVRIREFRGGGDGCAWIEQALCCGREPVFAIAGPPHKLFRIFRNEAVTTMEIRDAPITKTLELECEDLSNIFGHVVNLAQILPDNSLRFKNSWGVTGQCGLFTVQSPEVLIFTPEVGDTFFIDIYIDENSSLPHKYRTALRDFRFPNISDSNWFDFFDLNGDGSLDFIELRSALLYSIPNPANIDDWLENVLPDHRDKRLTKERFLACDGLRDMILDQLRPVDFQSRGGKPIPIFFTDAFVSPPPKPDRVAAAEEAEKQRRAPEEAEKLRQKVHVPPPHKYPMNCRACFDGITYKVRGASYDKTQNMYKYTLFHAENAHSKEDVGEIYLYPPQSVFRKYEEVKTARGVATVEPMDYRDGIWLYNVIYEDLSKETDVPESHFVCDTQRNVPQENPNPNPPPRPSLFVQAQQFFHSKYGQATIVAVYAEENEWKYDFEYVVSGFLVFGETHTVRGVRESELTRSVDDHQDARFRSDRRPDGENDSGCIIL